MREHHFEYHGEELPYFYHLYNLTHLNERCVELAVAFHWLKGRDLRAGLEVGNVTGHYRRMYHDVVDLHEEAAWYQQLARQRVMNVDLLDLPKRMAFPWVMSLSTIEHTDDPIKAIEILRNLVAPGGSLLVTFPTGVRDELDELIQWCDQTFTRWCTITRSSDDWVQDKTPVISPYGPWANSVAVCEWEAPA